MRIFFVFILYTFLYIFALTRLCAFPLNVFVFIGIGFFVRFFFFVFFYCFFDFHSSIIGRLCLSACYARQCSFIPLTISIHNGRIGLPFRLRTAAFSIFTRVCILNIYNCVLLAITNARARAVGSRLWCKQVELREKQLKPRTTNRFCKI